MREIATDIVQNNLPARLTSDDISVFFTNFELKNFHIKIKQTF